MKDVTAANFNFSKFQNPGSSQSRMRTVLTVKVSLSVIVTSLRRRCAAAAGTAASLEVNPDWRLQIILHQWSLKSEPITKSSFLFWLSIQLSIFQAPKLVWGRFASQRVAVPSTRKSVCINLKKKIWNRFFVKCQNVRPQHLLLGFNVIKHMY